MKAQPRFRAGHAPGELVLGGRRVSMQRPLVRSKDGREIAAPQEFEGGMGSRLARHVLRGALLGARARPPGAAR